MRRDPAAQYWWQFLIFGAALLMPSPFIYQVQFAGAHFWTWCAVTVGGLSLIAGFGGLAHLRWESWRGLVGDQEGEGALDFNDLERTAALDALAADLAEKKERADHRAEAQTVLDELSAAMYDTPRGRMSLADVFWEARDYFIQGGSVQSIWIAFARESPRKKGSPAADIARELVIHGAVEIQDRAETRFGELCNEQVLKATPLGLRILKAIKNRRPASDVASP